MDALALILHSNKLPHAMWVQDALCDREDGVVDGGVEGSRLSSVQSLSHVQLFTTP